MFWLKDHRFTDLGFLRCRRRSRRWRRAMPTACSNGAPASLTAPSSTETDGVFVMRLPAVTAVQLWRTTCAGIGVMYAPHRRVRYRCADNKTELTMRRRSGDAPGHRKADPLAQWGCIAPVCPCLDHGIPLERLERGVSTIRVHPFCRHRHAERGPRPPLPLVSICR